MISFSPRGLAMGIGSLPHTEPEDAIKLITGSLIEIPHWPQLPRLAETEGLIAQYLSPLINHGLAVQRPDRAPYIDTVRDDWPDRLTAFYSAYLEVLEGSQENYDQYAFPKGYAAGFHAFLRHLEAHGTGKARWLKGQISGPVTVGLQLTDQTGRSAYYDDQLRDLVIKNLAMQAAWQVKALSRFGLPVIIFVDEPALYAYGLSTHITLKKENLIEDINTVLQAIQNAGGLGGVHSCAQADWSILLESNTDIISFDAFSYFDSLALYSSGIKDFLSRGGVLAWGIIPTSEKATELTAMDLIALFKRQVEALVAKGVSYEALLYKALITPSCGTGNLDVPTAEKIYALTAEVSSYLGS